MRAACYQRTLRGLGVAVAGVGLLVSVGCMSKPRPPIVQIEPEFSYVDDAPNIVIEQVYAPLQPALTAADFVQGLPVRIGVE
ncbi:MAG: hypothetical protein AAGI68_08830 [Planctomycetota bacterium]